MSQRGARQRSIRWWHSGTNEGPTGPIGLIGSNAGMVPTQESEIGKQTMETLFRDVRYGIRNLLKQPGFAAVAVLSIALGIGVNTTIFSFINAALFRPLPFAEPDRLVRVWDGQAASYPDYVAYRDETKVFAGLAAYAQRLMVLVVNGITRVSHG